MVSEDSWSALDATLARSKKGKILQGFVATLLTPVLSIILLLDYGSICAKTLFEVVKPYFIVNFMYQRGNGVLCVQFLLSKDAQRNANCDWSTWNMVL